MTAFQKAVNVVRFSPNGDCLAASGDDGTIVVWRPSDNIQATCKPPQEGKPRWQWSQFHTEKDLTRTFVKGHHEDVYDLTWSPDSQNLMTASIDNTSSIVDVGCPTKEIGSIDTHSHYVQGVAWDPLNQYVVTCSSDRTVKVNELIQPPPPGEGEKKPLKKDKAEPPKLVMKAVASIESHKKKLFMDESLATFFRRLAWSPDGSLLFIPAGQVALNPLLNNTMTPVVHAFVRGNWKQPAWTCPMPEGRAAVAIRCSPVLYKLRNDCSQPTLSTAAAEESATTKPAADAAPEDNSCTGSVEETTVAGDAAATSTLNTHTPDPTGQDLLGAKFVDEELGECTVLRTMEHEENHVLWYQHKGDQEEFSSVAEVREWVAKTASAQQAAPSEDAVMKTEDAPAAAAGEECKVAVAVTTTAVAAAPEGESVKVNPYKPVSESGLLNKPYRMVYAVATLGPVLIYDTQSPKPLYIAKDLHCAQITDLSWSKDGTVLALCSADGYCTFMKFTDDKLGGPRLEITDPAYPKNMLERDTYRPTKFTYEEKKEAKPKVAAAAALVESAVVPTAAMTTVVATADGAVAAAAAANGVNPKKKKRATLIAVTGDCESNLVPSYHDPPPADTTAPNAFSTAAAEDVVMNTLAPRKKIAPTLLQAAPQEAQEEGAAPPPAAKKQKIVPTLITTAGPLASAAVPPAVSAPEVKKIAPTLISAGFLPFPFPVLPLPFLFVPFLFFPFRSFSFLFVPSLSFPFFRSFLFLPFLFLPFPFCSFLFVLCHFFPFFTFFSFLFLPSLSFPSFSFRPFLPFLSLFFVPFRSFPFFSFLCLPFLSFLFFRSFLFLFILFHSFLFPSFPFPPFPSPSRPFPFHSFLSFPFSFFFVPFFSFLFLSVHYLFFSLPFLS
jgi:WD40 repeat protein